MMEDDNENGADVQKYENPLKLCHFVSSGENHTGGNKGGSSLFDNSKDMIFQRL